MVSSLHTETPTRTTEANLWHWLEDVPDPEIPVVSVVDLGIIRAVAYDAATDTALITVTPTYSGCPATEVIATLIREALEAHGIAHVELRTQLAPAWTTDWLSQKARASLHAYGIAPPIGRAETAAGLPILQPLPQTPACPRCGSTSTEQISRFGSTPCKSLHRCLSCLEPFDHFKCH